MSVHDGPKILFVDIETSPSLAYIWKLWKENVPLARLVESGEMLCFAAKWRGQKKVHFASNEGGHQNMVELAHELLSEADAVVHYNGDRFDVPHLNREFLEARLGPPASYQSIDLYKVVRKNFKFPSNKLDYVAGRLLDEHKVQHSGFDLWVRCMANEASAWKEMRRYNVQDVQLLERLYDELLMWFDGPNPALFREEVDPQTLSCPKCGSEDLQRRGYRVNKTTRYPRYQCQDCGGWSTSGRRAGGVNLR